jgi:hypothetical protein
MEEPMGTHSVCVSHGGWEGVWMEGGSFFQLVIVPIWVWGDGSM